MCPPGLHISLGVFYRLFTLLKQACHELDLAVVQEASSEARAGATFERNMTALRQLYCYQEQKRTHEERATQLEQLANFLAISLGQAENSQALKLVHQEAASCRHRAHERVGQNYSMTNNITFYLMHTVTQHFRQLKSDQLSPPSRKGSIWRMAPLRRL